MDWDLEAVATAPRRTPRAALPSVGSRACGAVEGGATQELVLVLFIWEWVKSMVGEQHGILGFDPFTLCGCSHISCALGVDEFLRKGLWRWATNLWAQVTNGFHGNRATTTSRTRK